MREYAKGFVAKHGAHWRAIVDYRESDTGRRGRTCVTTRVPCYPDKVDPKTGRVTREDNRGKAAAEQFLREWRDGLMAKEGTDTSIVESTASFYAYAKDYLEGRERSGSIKRATTYGYWATLRRVLGSDMGNCKMAELTPRLIRDWEAQQFEDGLSANTVSHDHVFLKQVCRYAVRAGELARNPFELVDAPRREHRPVNSLDKAGLAKLNAALEGYGSEPLAIAAKLALMTGMRQGEICALRWRDVDLVANTLKVSYSLTRGHGGYKMSDPKTRSSIRTIPFGASLAKVLEGRRRLQLEERWDLGLPWDDNVFVIGSAVDGTWKNPYLLGREWHALTKAIRLRGTHADGVRFHDLRHTFATMAIASKVDVKTVSAILGHSNAAMTLNVYADALSDTKKASMDIMDQVLSSTEPAEPSVSISTVTRQVSDAKGAFLKVLA